MAWGIMLISVRTRDVRLGRVEHARNSFSRLGWVGQTSLTTVGNVGSRIPSSWSRVRSIWIRISSSLGRVGCWLAWERVARGLARITNYLSRVTRVTQVTTTRVTKVTRATWVTKDTGRISQMVCFSLSPMLAEASHKKATKALERKCENFVRF